MSDEFDLGSFKPLNGRVAIVTGAAGSIGMATTRRLAANGAAVVMADSNATAAAQVHQITMADGGKVAYIPTDVTVGEDLAALVALALSRFGRVDAVINSAADLSEVPFDETTTASWQRLLAVNLIAPAELVRVALPELAATSGCVVNVASVRALASLTGAVAYEASKAGLLGLTRALATELAPAQIRVNAVSPGFTPRQIPWHQGLSPAERRAWSAVNAGSEPGTADQVAAVIAFLCSEDARHINGANLVVDGGALAQSAYQAAIRALAITEAP